MRDYRDVLQNLSDANARASQNSMGANSNNRNLSSNEGIERVTNEIGLKLQRTEGQS